MLSLLVLAQLMLPLHLVRVIQGPWAETMLHAAMERGHWVFFQNCHLAPSWMPALERLIENIDPVKVRIYAYIYCTIVVLNYVLDKPFIDFDSVNYFLYCPLATHVPQPPNRCTRTSVYGSQVFPATSSQCSFSKMGQR